MNDDNNKDFRSDLDYWQAMWDEMESSGVHPEPEMPKAASKNYGSDPKDTYYSYFDDQHGQDSGHPESDYDALLQEERQSTPNPVYPDSKGPDHLNTEPVWVKEDAFKAIEDLKGKLFDVENRLAKEMGGGEKWVEKCHHPNDKKLMSEIESLRKRIEKVSSRLGVEDEESPWVVQRD